MFSPVFSKFRGDGIAVCNSSVQRHTVDLEKGSLLIQLVKEIFIALDQNLWKIGSNEPIDRKKAHRAFYETIRLCF